MEMYLKLFERVIQKQADLIGTEEAHKQAKMAGLGVSEDGHIICCTGNPVLVLMKLIRYFTAGGNLLALVECTPLIDELIKISQKEEVKY